MASTDALSDLLWKYFRYAKFVFMLIALWIFLSLYQGCSLRSVPLKNHQMTPTYNPGKDMLVIDPTIHSQDTGLVQGDAVVYEYQSLASKGGEPPVFMGRIIAFGGQRVRVEDGDIYVNGSKISEAGYLNKDNREDFTIEEIVVPAGHVYLLVDNRSGYKQFRFQTRLRDSRHLGPIKEWCIVGKIKDKFKYGKGS